MRYITHSGAQALWACPRSWWWRYVQGVRRKHDDGGAKGIGTMVHQWLAGEAEPPAPEALESHDQARALAMLPHALRFEGGEQEVRLERKLPGVRGWRAAGKLDNLKRYIDGTLVGDYKTCSKELGEEATQQRASMQWPIYRYLLGVDGPTELSLMRKTEQRKRKRETPQQFYERIMEEYDKHPGAYFGRVHVDTPPSAVDAAVAWLVQSVQFVRWCEKQKEWPRRYGHGCRTPWNRWCDYKRLCWDNAIEEYEQEENPGQGELTT